MTILSFFPLVALWASTPQLQCTDILQEYATKPTNLEFVECVENPDEQTVLEARYRVSGNKAAEVEAFLVKHYQMKPLRFVCCGWETKNGQDGSFKASHVAPDQAYRVYSVRMYSDETLVDDRKAWASIPYFYVTAEIADI